MINYSNVPVKIWQQKINPYLILKLTTFVNIIFYFSFLLHSFIAFEGEPFPSVSAMIGASRISTISYTIIVFVHGYTIMSYLVIASEYVGFYSIQFRFIFISSIIYWLSLIMVSYLPVKNVNEPHNIFAILAFMFSVSTVYLHKHTFLNTDEYVPYFMIIDRNIVVLEISIIILVSILGILFWVFHYTIAEYVFIFLLLCEKYFKINILISSGLLNIESAFLEYSYYSPSNNKNTEKYTSEYSDDF